MAVAADVREDQLDDPAGETERLAVLETYGVMDTAAEAAFDELTQLAAELFQAPIALVSLIDAKRQWFKSKVGLDVDETPRELAFCNHVVRAKDVMVVPDATADTRFADHPAVTGGPEVRFYAGAPLITPTGLALGSLCVVDRTPRPDLGVREKQILRKLATFVMIELDYRRLAREAERNLDEALALIDLEVIAKHAIPDADPIRQAHEARAVEARVTQLKDRCYRMATWFDTMPRAGVRAAH